MYLIEKSASWKLPISYISPCVSLERYKEQGSGKRPRATGPATTN